MNRAVARVVLGLTLPVASLEDVLRGKICAVEDISQRASIRQKDLADISRLLEAYPHLRPLIPAGVLEKLV